MIKITQLLTESFTTYKKNFKKIFWIVLPILILGIISEYYAAAFTKMLDSNDYSNITYLITSILIYVVSILAVSLYFGPVINRAIQKKEDDGHFNTNAAYNFQKKNIFKWIMVNIWGFLYIVWVMLPYIGVVFLMYVIFVISPSYTGNSLELLGFIIDDLYLLCIFFIGLGVILNIHKFILYKNIFFSKDEVSARNAVRESIKLGMHKKGQVWMLILTLIISTIVMMLVYFVLGFLMGLIVKFIPGSVAYIESIISATISVLFFLPFMSIVVSKGYVKIRG